MTIHVRAPATSANIGPGFDVAAVALDLWNELEVGEANGQPVDETHRAVRAFSRFASPEGRSFTFTDRIPRERGSTIPSNQINLRPGGDAGLRRSTRRASRRNRPA